MSAAAWKLINENLFGCIIIFCLFGGGFLSWGSNLFGRLLDSLDPKEVKLARIEANRQIEIARANRIVNEEDDE